MRMVEAIVPQKVTDGMPCPYTTATELGVVMREVPLQNLQESEAAWRRKTGGHRAGNGGRDDARKGWRYRGGVVVQGI
jgi:hypothetical protein